VLELQYVDETGTKGAVTVKYAAGTPYASIDAEASALASIIAPITGCSLIRQRIIYKAVQVPKTVPSIGSDVVRQGMFFFEDGTGESQVLFGIPGFLESKVVTTEPGAGVLIDTSDSDVIALITQFEASGMVNPFNVECYELIAAYLQSRV